MSVVDAVVSFLMKMLSYSAIQCEWSISKGIFLNTWRKTLRVCARLSAVLSCDGTCLAPCCGCSHWAVITHLTGVWNIHRQVSPSLWVSHMDSLLSPPSALNPRSLYSTCLLLHPTHLSASGYTLHSQPLLRLKLQMPLSLPLNFATFFNASNWNCFSIILFF